MAAGQLWDRRQAESCRGASGDVDNDSQSASCSHQQHVQVRLSHHVNVPEPLACAIGCAWACVWTYALACDMACALFVACDKRHHNIKRTCLSYLPLQALLSPEWLCQAAGATHTQIQDFDSMCNILLVWHALKVPYLSLHMAPVQAAMLIKLQAALPT